MNISDTNRSPIAVNEIAMMFYKQTGVLKAPSWKYFERSREGGDGVLKIYTFL